MGQIPFTRGVPSADMLPVDDLREAAAQAFATDAGRGAVVRPGGYPPLREWIGERHGVDAARVLLVNGSLQGVDVPGAAPVPRPRRRRAGRGSDLRPHADRAAHVRRDRRAACPLTGEGIDVDALERALGAGPRRPRCTLIPTFQNPAGVHAARGRPPAAWSSWPARTACWWSRTIPTACCGSRASGADAARARRRRQRHLLLVVHQDGGARPAHRLPDPARAPGRAAGAAISENTIIGPNTLAEATLAAYCRAGRFEPNVERATADAASSGATRWRRRCATALPGRRALDDARPGGYFYWVDLPEALDTGGLLAGGRPSAASPTSRAPTSACPGGGRSSLRLAFSAVPPEQIGEGIARLGELLAERSRPPAV